MMKRILKRKETTLLISLVVLVLLVTLRAPSFIGPKNLNNILNDTCALIIVAMGQFMVILIGGIDLSVASTMAFTGMVTALLNQYSPGIPAWTFLPIAAAIGAGLGALSGSLVAFGGLPPMIATIATMSIYRGFVYVFSKGAWVTARDMSPSFLSIPSASFLGLSSMVWITIAVVIAAAIFMRYTSSGREVYAFGGNKTASKFAGVSERKVELLVLTASGLLAGLVGVLWVSRYGMSHSETASGFEMQTVAACVLGGVSFVGGSGTVPGVLIGALFFGVINNALTVVRISPFFQMAIQGFIILFAIVSNTLIDRKNQMKLVARRKL
jgi:rhamnose transport system permease protein